MSQTQTQQPVKTEWDLKIAEVEARKAELLARLQAETKEKEIAADKTNTIVRTIGQVLSYGALAGALVFLGLSNIGSNN